MEALLLTEDSELFGWCEFCRIGIYEGDRYHLCADGGFLCEACAPNLSDIIAQRVEVLARVPFDPGDLDFSRDELKQNLAALRADLAAHGDRKMTVEA